MARLSTLCGTTFAFATNGASNLKSERNVPILQRLLGSAEGKHTEPEHVDHAPASDGDEELSDSDLEEVLGGLERIHFPTPIDLPELET